jgi:hypothetical protein
VKTYLDHAFATQRRLDRYFWLTAAADTINEEPDNYAREPLFRLAARRIHSTHAVRPDDRQAAVRFLAAKVLPLV